MCCNLDRRAAGRAVAFVEAAPILPVLTECSGTLHPLNAVNRDSANGDRQE
jgi:hypothetical protein